LTHVSTLESKKKLGSKNLIYGLKTIFETRKIKIDYMNKANANKIKTLEIKLAFVVSSSPCPQGDLDSNLIVAKMLTSNEEKWGAKVRGPIGPILI
jgi:hypothetical protein